MDTGMEEANMKKSQETERCATTPRTVPIDISPEMTLP